MSIAEKLVTIAENEQRVYEAGRLKTLQDSEYMNAKVSGTVIAVNDVSPIEHSVGCTLSSKNILNPYSYELTRGDVVIEDDGSIVLDGGMETGGEIIYTVNLVDTYVLSFGVQTDFNGVTIYVDGNDCTEDFKNNATLGLATASVFREHTHEIKLIQGSQTTSLLYIQLEKGTTATPYTPYIADLSTVEVSRYGKNLLPGEVHDFSKWTVSDGMQKKFYFDKLTPGCRYTFSYDLITPLEKYGYLYLGIIDADGKSTKVKDFTQINLLRKKYSFTAQSGCRYFLFGWFAANTSTGMLENNIFKAISNFQLELGTSKTTYEPYIEPTTYQANPDGIVDGITSVSPSMTLIPSNDGVVINANYLRDIDTYIDNLITDVALTGGE